MRRPTPPLRWRALSLPRSDSTAQECEDAWATDPATGRFAVADGASESAYAGLWARLLVEGFIAARRPGNFVGWLDGPRDRWAAEVMGPELPWYGEMKRAAGAFATLLGLRVRPPRTGRPGRWQAAAVGDACLVRARDGRHVRAFPVERSSDFGNEPPLIGSRGDLPTARVRASGSLRDGDQLFLMTDALAQWFLRTHERGGRPSQSVARLLLAPRPQDAFATWVDGLRKAGDLRDDDVTLLSVEPGAAPGEGSR
jgi:hypothetical protein